MLLLAIGTRGRYTPRHRVRVPLVRWRGLAEYENQTEQHDAREGLGQRLVDLRGVSSSTSDIVNVIP